MFCYLINLIEVFGFAINGYCIILKEIQWWWWRKSVMNLFMTWKFKWRQNYNHKSFIFFLPPSRHDLSLLTIITVILWFHFHSLWQIFWMKSLANSNAINEEERRALIKKWLIHLQLSSHRVFNLATSGSTNIKNKKFAFVLLLDCVPFKKILRASVKERARRH